jgi:subtilase family serine protease
MNPAKKRGVVVRAAWTAVCTVLLLAMVANRAEAQRMPTRHVRDVVVNGQARFVQRMPAAQTMRLDVVLPLRDPMGLENFLKDVYDPASIFYRHFVTPAEFTERFGPSQGDYDAAVSYLGANGLTVVGGSRDGMDIQVEGSVASIERAFHVNMDFYQHPTESRMFYAPDREPTTDLGAALWHVSGLDNYSIPHPLFVKRSEFAAAHGLNANELVSHATTGSGPSASFLGSDMRAAYYGGTALTGAGQNLGLFEFLGTDLTDLTTYYKNVGQTNNVPITVLSTDGTSTSCVDSRTGGDCDDTEQTLDMTQALGMAPGLASLVMYVGSTDTAMISAMTTHSPLPTTIGCSWGWTPADPSTLNPYFQKMAAQGQNFFAASGDSSTWSSRNEAWPADNAYIVSVGGTDLTTASAGGPWKSETAWVDSGGGISPDGIAIPSWQQISGVINSSNKGSTTLRNGPDVSANANFTFYVCADQTTCTANEYGGTSFATPMWAGYVALVNQQLADNGQPTIGFINPTIYSQNVTSSYATDFHDITSGTSGSFSAVTGYDLVTGWGSPNGVGLINALAGSSTSTPSFSISASPGSVSVVQGGNGSSTVSTSVTGGFDSAVALSASGQPSGVTVTFNPTSIAAPGTGSSAMSIAVASSVATGTYTITVTGTGGGVTQTAKVSLTVTAPVSGSFTLSASPSSVTVDEGSSASTTVTITPANGFSGSVTLSTSALPNGVTAAFSPNPATGTSTLTFTASRTATRETVTVTITGTSGSLKATTTMSLRVRR